MFVSLGSLRTALLIGFCTVGCGLASAQEEEAVPTPFPSMQASPMPSPTALATQMPSPNAPPPTPVRTQTSPVPTPRASVPPTPRRTANPALSGQIDYTFDALAVRDGLQTLGVETIPKGYRPLASFSGSGVSGYWIVGDSETTDTQLLVFSLDNPQEIYEKMYAFSRVRLPGFLHVMPRASKGRCTTARTYRIGPAVVRSLNCSDADGKLTHSQSTNIASNGHLISVQMTTKATKNDDATFKSVVAQLLRARHIYVSNDKAASGL